MDKLLDLGRQVRDMLALVGRNVDRSEIIEFIFCNGGVDQKIAATAWVSTKTALAPMVKNQAADNWVLSHPDLAVFYPFLWDGLDEEQQLEWQRMYAFRR